VLIAALFVVFPAALYYTVLFRKVVDIPNLDGYDALLGFLNHLIQLKSMAAKVSWFLTSQQGEFKLYGLLAAWSVRAYRLSNTQYCRQWISFTTGASAIENISTHSHICFAERSRFVSIPILRTAA